MRESRGRGQKWIDDDEQVERAQRTFGLALLGQGDHRIASVDEQRAHPAGTRRKDLVCKRASHLLAEHATEIAHTAQRLVLPAASRRDHLRLSGQPCAEHTGIGHAVARTGIAATDDVEAFDQVLRQVRVRTHVRPGAGRGGTSLAPVGQRFGEQRRGAQQIFGATPARTAT